MKEEELVMLRLETQYGYTDTWWRVMFIDNDGTFIGKLERHHWHEYTTHKKGDNETFDCDRIQQVYKDGDQFCYSDKITICKCEGLCRENY